MFACRCLQIILYVVLAIAVFSGSAQAQNINKCVGANGKITFSDLPCSDGKAVEFMNKKPGGKGTAIDVNALCRNIDQNELTKTLTCRAMRQCEQHQTPENCDFYCQNFMMGMDVELWPGSGIVKGPTSELCLTKTKRIRGANWVEVRERTSDLVANNEYRVTYKCINRNGRLEINPAHVFCSLDDTRCHPPDINVRNPQLQPIDTLISKTCQSAK